MEMNQSVNIRFFHATPQTPPVDVYVNNQLVFQRLGYQQQTSYLPVMPGLYQIRLVNSDTQQILLDQPLRLFDDRYLTIIALAETNQIGLLSLPDKSVRTNKSNDVKYPFKMEEGKAIAVTQTNNRKEVVQPQTPVRFVHLSPNAPSVDVYIDETPLFRNIMYKGASNYIDVVPVRYNIVVRHHRTNQELLRIPNFVVPENSIITLYLTGLVGMTPSLEIIVLHDGITANTII